MMEYQNERTNTQKGAGKKRTAVTLVISAVAVIAMTAVGVSMLVSSPLALVGTGFANSAKAIEKSEVAVFFEKFTDGGSAEIFVGLEELLASALGIRVDAAAQLKLYSDGDDGAALAADLKLGGVTFLDVLLNATKQDITLTSDAILGKTAYGVDLENAAENFKNSVFGPNGPYSLGIDTLDEFTDSIAQGEEIEEDAAQIEESFLVALLESVDQNAEISKENKELDFNGVQAKTTAVRIVLESDAAAAVAVDMVEYLYTDEELKQFLHTYEAMVADYLMGLDLISYYDDPGEAIDDFYDALEEIYMNPQEFAQQIEDSGIMLDAVFYVSKTDKELVGMELLVELDEEEFEISLLAGPALSDLCEISVKVKVDGTLVRGTYRVDTNDRAEYAAKFSLREEGDVLTSGEFRWDKKAGNYALTVRDAYDEAITLEGTLKVSDQQIALTLGRIAVGGDALELQIELTLKASDQKPAMPEEYTDLLTMSQGEIEDLTADLAAELMNMGYALDPDVLGVLSSLFFGFV